MPRARARRKSKVKVGVSLDATLHDWAISRVGGGREFATLTHAIERGLAALRDRERRKPESE